MKYGLAMATSRLWCALLCWWPLSCWSISLAPLSGERNELSVNYGLCGNFERVGYGSASNREANLVYSRVVARRHVLSAGLGHSRVAMDLPLVERSRENGVHGLLDYQFFLTGQGRWRPYFNTALHKMDSAHFERNEWTAYLGVIVRYTDAISLFLGPGIAMTQAGVRGALRDLAARRDEAVYETEMEFAYHIGVFYRQRQWGVYFGNGPANVLGAAVSMSY